LLEDEVNPRTMCLCVFINFINIVLNNSIFSCLNETQRTHIASSVYTSIASEDKKYNKHYILNTIKNIIKRTI